MKLKFAYHAQYRIVVERGISIENIKAVIKNPDYFYAMENNAVVAKKHVHGKHLTVVFVKKRNEYIIITSYYV